MKLNVHLYKLYLGDSNQIAEIPPVGYEYEQNSGKLVIEKQTDENENEDPRLARIWAKLLIPVQESIKETSDYPSKNEDGKMC